MIPAQAPPRPLSLLFLDPIGHGLGAHDAAICRELAARGHRVILGTNDHEPPAPRDGRYEVWVPYRRVVGDGGRLGKWRRYWSATRRIVREAPSREIDAAILYYVLEPNLDSLFVGSLRRKGIPVVVCAHDVLPLHRARDPFFAWKRVYSAATRVVAFSRAAAAELAGRHGIDPARIDTTHLGIDHWEYRAGAGQAAAREALGIPPGGPVILCFGQIKRNKSLDLLLASFKHLLPAHPRAMLWIVGRPWRVDISPLKEEAAGPAYGGRVHFRSDWIRNEQVPLWFEAADLVVLPYRRLYQSDVLARAVASERPVVATAVGSTPELIRDGESGWLVPPEDAPGLEAAIRSALDEPAEARRRALNASKDLRERFTWASTARTLEESLARALCAPVIPGLER